MGSDRCMRSRLVARCCYGVSFGFGFVLTVITLAVMFWIAWCYFGLTIVQITDTQRRAVVNYSYTTSKPISTPTTAAPSRSTTIATEETSVNSISKLPTSASVLRGSSRGESQVKLSRKEASVIESSLSKGDSAARDRATHNSNSSSTKDASSVSVDPSPRGQSRKKDETRVNPPATAAILSGSASDESDDRVHARRVLPPGTSNRPDEKGETSDRPLRRNSPDSEPVSRIDIAPTKVYDADATSGSSKVEDPVDKPAREYARTPPRDYVDRDKLEPPSRRLDIQSSRRPDPEPALREPDFDREYPKRYATSSDRERSRYDDGDVDDERGSRGRYDKRDRGRESDDRYSKGDTRVYPDDKDDIVVRPPARDDRYRERYPDVIPKRGDDDRYDDRYRDYDEAPRTRDRDSTRYKERDVDRPPIIRDERYKDDERYRARDEDRYRDRDDDRYRSRSDERYRPRDDDSYRPRDDDRTKPRDEDRIRPRDEDRIRPRDEDRIRPRDEDRIRPRDDEDRYRPRDDDRYRPRDDDRYRDDDKYRAREDEKYRTRDDYKSERDPEVRRDSPSRERVEEDRYRSRTDDAKYVDSSAYRLRDEDTREPISRSGAALPLGDRKPTSSRSDYDARVEETVTDYDIPARDRSRSRLRDDVSPSRLSRPVYDEERYRDRDREDSYRRPSRYEDDVRSIAPTRTKDDSSFSRSALMDSRPRDGKEDSRYVDDPRDRIRDDRYYDQDDRIRRTRLQDSSSLPTSESSRRPIDDSDRYRTRLPSERIEDSKSSDRKEDVVLDRRSYGSDEYRRGALRTESTYEDRTRSPVEDTRRRYRDPIDDEDYKRSRPREDYDRDRSASRDRYDDDEYRRYDDRYTSRDEDRYSRGDLPPPLPIRRYDEDERPRRRDSEISTVRKEDDRGEKLRPSSSARDEERLYSRDEFPDSKSSRRRYDDDDFRDRDSDDRRYSRGSRTDVNAREPEIGSSTSSVRSREPSDVVIRENKQSSRLYSDGTSNDRSLLDVESKSREQVRPASAKDVIEAAIRHSDTSDQNPRKVYYPVFDPRVSNLTSPDVITRKEWRGTTITTRKRRSA